MSCVEGKGRGNRQHRFEALCAKQHAAFHTSAVVVLINQRPNACVSHAITISTRVDVKVLFQEKTSLLGSNFSMLYQSVIKLTPFVSLLYRAFHGRAAFLLPAKPIALPESGPWNPFFCWCFRHGNVKYSWQLWPWKMDDITVDSQRGGGTASEQKRTACVSALEPSNRWRMCCCVCACLGIYGERL